MITNSLKRVQTFADRNGVDHFSKIGKIDAGDVFVLWNDDQENKINGHSWFVVVEGSDVRTATADEMIEIQDSLRNQENGSISGSWDVLFAGDSRLKAEDPRRLLFYKNKDSDLIYWIDNAKEKVGEWLFTFDKRRIFNLFADYPHNLTPEQKAVFDSENPYWAEFFEGAKDERTIGIQENN